jgi:hypothetical protein
MKAIQYQSYGNYSENRLVELPRPQLREGEVLIEMRSVGINPLDNTFRSGNYYMATPENLPRIGGQRARAQSSRARATPSMSAIACSSGGQVSASLPMALGASLSLHLPQAFRTFLTVSMTIRPRPSSRAQDI